MAFLDETGLAYLLEYIVPNLEGSFTYTDMKISEVNNHFTEIEEWLTWLETENAITNAQIDTICGTSLASGEGVGF